MKLLSSGVELFYWTFCPVVALLYTRLYPCPFMLGCVMWLQTCRFVSPENARRFVYRFLAYNSVKTMDPRCMNNLGVCYARGLGTVRCPRKAFLWYKQSGARGCVQALHTLGGCYYNGFGTDVDYECAYKAFYRALKLGHVPSACFLGLMYARGEYVDRSERRSYLWYRYGALHGDCNAQYDYSVCLRYGEGCKKSDEEADKWLSIAAGNGSEEALACIRERDSK